MNSIPNEFVLLTIYLVLALVVWQLWQLKEECG